MYLTQLKYTSSTVFQSSHTAPQIATVNIHVNTMFKTNVQSFQGCLSWLQIVLCNQSCNFSIGNVEFYMTSDDIYHVRIHHFNTVITWLIAVCTSQSWQETVGLRRVLYAHAYTACALHALTKNSQENVYNDAIVGVWQIQWVVITEQPAHNAKPNAGIWSEDSATAGTFTEVAHGMITWIGVLWAFNVNGVETHSNPANSQSYLEGSKHLLGLP